MEPQETTQKDPSENEIITTPLSAENAPLQETAIKEGRQPATLAAAIITSAAMIAIALVLVLHPKSTGTSPTAGNTAQQPATPTSVTADIVTVRPSDTDHVRGDLSTAQVLIFEYSDSDCPYCEQFHPTLQQVVSDYKGKVAWVYRFFPLDIHPNSRTESIALQCVSEIGGAKAFNTYLDTLINVTLSPNATSDKALTTFATQQGIDTAKFNACVIDPATATFVDNSIQEAGAIGAQGTPFSIAVSVKTGKQIIIPGAYPLADVEKDIDSLLK
jgi:protein-disulfide isomerase